MFYQFTSIVKDNIFDTGPSFPTYAGIIILFVLICLIFPYPILTVYSINQNIITVHLCVCTCIFNVILPASQAPL